MRWEVESGVFTEIEERLILLYLNSLVQEALNRKTWNIAEGVITDKLKQLKQEE